MGLFQKNIGPIFLKEESDTTDFMWYITQNVTIPLVKSAFVDP